MSQQIINTVNAVPLDLKAYSGSIIGKNGLEITLTDQNGSPINPVNTLRMEVRQNAQSPVLLLFTNGDGLTCVGNVITLYKMVDLKGGEYLYDLVEEMPDGSTEPYFFGRFIVTQNITKPRG